MGFLDGQLSRYRRGTSGDPVFIEFLGLYVYLP